MAEDAPASDVRRLRHTVDSAAALEKVVEKAPRATVVLPELADEESPEGWQLVGETEGRVVARVRQLIEKALHDLLHEIPEMYRDLPEVEEQRQKLRDLLGGGNGAWPFTVELVDPPPLEVAFPAGGADAGALPEWASIYVSGGDPREHFVPSAFTDARDLGPEDDGAGRDSAAVGPREVLELGAAGDLKRLVIAPGNGCSPIGECNWYAWLQARLRGSGALNEAVCRDFPDPDDAKREIWLPFLREELRVGPDTILVGHSSGAQAAMRLAEEGTLIGGLVLVSACHTDLGDAGERASGYYPPDGGEWQWERIRKNCGWIVQFHSRDDPLVPVEEGRKVAQELQSEYFELDGHSHFFEPCEKILEVILSKLQASG